MYRFLFVVITFFCVSHTLAHQLSTSYLHASINDKGVIQGELQVRLYDLEQALAIDADSNGELLWRELMARETEISDYLNQHLSITRGEKICTTIFPDSWQIDSHFNEGYLVLPMRAQCALAGLINIKYSAFFNEDSQHKLILSFNGGENKSPETRVISVGQPDINFNAENGDHFASFREFVYQGVIHIWIGTDHVLFLCSLLLTCVLTRRAGQWVGKKNIREIVIHTTWIVTAFTLAHSITLTATALDLLQFSSRWIEAGIALSVVFTALNNIFPMVLRLGVLTFCFGLLHGMGFAGALGELGIPADEQLFTVLAFNIGVELGQMAIVLAVLPILIAVRNKFWYSRYSVVAISIVISLIAAQWVVERIFY
ncbi:MAG: HupE/UreJ family protein [Chitinophagaceae bacterium]|nr:MAG: HupE/UreJ family protein [Chitinophagaceae bacterium]